MCYSLTQTALAHTEDGASIIKPYAYIVSVEITNDGPRGKLLVDKEVFTAYVYPGAISIVTLTNWGRDKMATISQTTFSNALPCMKMYQLRSRFRLSLFLRFELTIQRWFR